MVIDLLGILEDGSDRSPLLPASAKRTLEIPINARLVFQLSVVNAARIPVVLDGSVVNMTWKRSYLDATPLLTVTGVYMPQIAKNRMDFIVQAAQTKSFASGRGVWDIRRILGSNVDPLIPLSTLILLPTVGTSSVSVSPPTPSPLYSQNGVAAFSSQQTVQVVFSTPMASADYSVVLGGSLDTGDGSIIVPYVIESSKTTMGFTIGAGATVSGAVNWSANVVTP